MSRKKKSRRNRSGSSSRSLSQSHSQTHKMPDAEPQVVPSADVGVVADSVWHFKQAWEQLRTGNLVHITLVYLALPLLLFLFGWLKLIYALPLAALLIFLLAHWLGAIKASVHPETRSLVICGIVALLWTSASGVGGFGFQNIDDYYKHNAMLQALTTSEWPVFLGPDTTLVYTLGYYLPGAVVGKVVGWAGTNLAIFAWTVLGVWMTLLWFVHHVQSRLIWLAPLFVVLSGMDIIAWWLYQPSAFPEWGTHIEWPAGLDFFQLSGMSSLLYWVPQHALSGWLGAALFLQLKDEDSFYKNSFLLGACLAIWSFFTSLGVALLIVAYFIFRPQHIKAALSPLKQISGALFAVAILLYIFSSEFSIEHGFFAMEITEKSNWSRYLIVLIVEFGVVGFCAFWLASASQRRLLIAVCVLFALIPLYRVGIYHDMAMRTTVPAFFVFWCLVLNSCLHSNATRAVTRRFVAVIAVCIAFGLPAPAMEIYRSLSQYTTPIPKHELWPLVGEMPNDDITRQYLGLSQTPFFQLLAPSEINLNDPALMSQQAALLLRYGRNEEALEVYQRIVDITPDDKVVYRNQGVALVRLGRFQEAQQSFDRVHTIDPNYLPEYLSIYFAVGDAGRILEILQSFAFSNPTDAQNHFNLTWAYFAQGRRQEATESLKRTLEIAPDFEIPPYMESLR